ncbi:sulfurtransferase [Cysteiniphilum sp. JM-1]|uniref:sulfurtransferase n=1 Tax=Cysteiniphilum sp. JM-1 TaxID=2610891 RepID=UPI0012455AEE|nr:sulfurtransferase [Cysteiniphilum sp. JM-1]
MLHLKETTFVSTEWLHNNLNLPQLVILDATLTDKKCSASFIPQSRYFDLKQHFSDLTNSLPHTLPQAQDFALAAAKLGIHNDSIIVVYDQNDIYSSARCWWMFKAMGHHNIYILDGGLPQWLNDNLPTTTCYITSTTEYFTATLTNGYFCDKEHILNNLDSKSAIVFDARSPARFSARELETRDNLNSGHIPQSINMHYASVLDQGCFKSKETLAAMFATYAPSLQQPLIFTCGLGVTACILAAAAKIVGYRNTSVYDGSWSEWGNKKLQLPFCQQNHILCDASPK